MVHSRTYRQFLACFIFLLINRKNYTDVFCPLANTTTSEIVLESLREQIINGILQPQEKLVEAEIARKFGLSRGPVREALRQLAVEGLVDYCPNKGCTVALLSPQDAYEVFFLRGSLEKLESKKVTASLVTIVS